MPKVSAVDFVDWLFDKTNKIFAGRTPGDRVEVTGRVDPGGRSTIIERQLLENFDFENGIDLSNSHFGSRLEIRNCTSPDFLLRETVIEGSLQIACEQIGFIVLEMATIKGAFSIFPSVEQLHIKGLDLTGSRIKGSASFNDDTPGQIIVSGDVLLLNARVGGDLSLFNVDIGGSLAISNIRVDGNIYLNQSGGPDQSLTIRDRLWANKAEVHGDFVVRGATIGSFLYPDKTEVAFNLVGATIGGQLRLSPAMSDGDIAIEGDINVRGHIEASSIRCYGGLALSAITIEGDLNLSYSEFSNFFASPVESSRVVIAGDLHLSAIKGRPWIKLEAISVGGDFRMLGSEISNLDITVGWLWTGDQDHEFDVVPSLIGRLLIRGTEVHGNLSIPFIQIDGTKFDADRQGVVIEGSTIHGSLDFWSPWKIRDLQREKSRHRPISKHPIRPWRYSAAVIGDIRIENSTIRGELNLSFAKATGRIDVNSSHVIGGLMLCSTKTVTADLADSEESRSARDEKPRDPLMRASASELVLRMLRIDNDLDLTGLSLFEDKQQNNPRADRSGAVDARHLTVTGKIKAYDQSGASRTYIEVPGKFDLSNVSAAELEISGDSFPPTEAEPDEKHDDPYHNGIVLAGGTIATLRIPEIDAREKGRPYPIGLHDLTVKSWEIGDRKDGLRYLNLLKKDKDFRRSNYTSIESYLRNSGEDRYAIEVYREMYERERSELRERFREKKRLKQQRPGLRARLNRIGLWFFSRIGYGTNLWPLFFLILGAGVLAYPLYRHPANIEPSIPRLAGHVDRDTDRVPRQGKSPDPKTWTVADAIWMEFRYHVPVAELALRHEWTMRDDHHAIYDLAAFLPGKDFPSCMPQEKPAPAAASHQQQHPSGAPQPSATSGECNSATAFNLWMAAEDAVAMFTVFNYIVWPLLIGFLVRKLLRPRED